MDETPPKIRNCRRCLRVVIEAWVDGLFCTADPVALSLRGQLHARESGRELYELVFPRFGSRKAVALVERTAERIMRGGTCIAVASHVCVGAPDPAHLDMHEQEAINKWMRPQPKQDGLFAPPF